MTHETMKYITDLSIYLLLVGSDGNILFLIVLSHNIRRKIIAHVQKMQ